MAIKIQRLSDAEKTQAMIPPEPAEVDGWNIWESKPSKFNWHYESVEHAYLYKGKVNVTSKDGTVEIKAGDFVTFPIGLSCTWEVLEKVVKVYKFE